METEYRTMTDLYGGALYHRFAFLCTKSVCYPAGNGQFGVCFSLMDVQRRDKCTIPQQIMLKIKKSG